MTSQAAFSEGPISAPTGRTSSAPLIGNVGQEFVQTVLSTNDPATALTDIQTRAALSDPRCRPLLGLLDQLGLGRAESHRYIVEQALEVLLSRIPSLPPERLLGLLEETFPYITIPDLRAVPLAVLDRLRPVPATFLKQLASDREIFWELPVGVQRQAWELDRKLLTSHALSLVAAYTYETATWVQALNMDEANAPLFTPLAAKSSKLDPSSEKEGGIIAVAVGKGSEPQHSAPAAAVAAVAGKLPQLARRNLRNGSAALRHLVAMVGPSLAVYRGIVDLCTARFREAETPFVGMKDAALCALRSQLLMAIHDAGETGITHGDPCHKLAWTLDACLKDQAFSKRHVNEIQTFFSSFIIAAKARRKSLGMIRGNASGGSRRGQRALSDWDVDDDAESAGVPGAASASEDPLRELGAAGMVLRDPATFHLMLHEVVRCLERCVAEESVPKDDLDLIFLTQLLTLAVSVRGMLREGEYDFPDPNPDVIDTLYPLIANLILDAVLEEDLDGGGDGDVDPTAASELVSLMMNDELCRRVVQMYALKRLAEGDLKTGCRVLQAIVSKLFMCFLSFI